MADENFDNDLLLGFLRRHAQLNAVRAQDRGEVGGQDEPTLLTWATAQDRLLLTHDATALIPAMREGLAKRGRCTSIVLVSDMMPISDAIEHVLLLDAGAVESDWDAGVLSVPLSR